MNQIENIMALHHEAAKFRAFTGMNSPATLEADQALRDAIEQALAPGEPTYSIRQVDRAYELGLSEGKKDAPQPQPEQEPEIRSITADPHKANKAFLNSLDSGNFERETGISVYRLGMEQVPQPQPKQEPGLHGATHRQPITGGLYKQIGGVWHVWSRIENEPKSWIKSPGTHESGLEKISASPQPQNCATHDLTAECESLRRALRIAVAIIQNEYPEEQWPDYRVPEMLAALKEQPHDQPKPN